jgi:aldose 1-epimerase
VNRPLVFDHLPGGRAVKMVRLCGPRLCATVLTMGATVQDLRLDGVDHPLVLGFPRLAPYLREGLYVGALVGLVANRIAGARFSLDGQQISLEPNEGANLLHGGWRGVHQQIWQIVALGQAHVVLGLTLPEGATGFPGEVQLRAEISVAGDALSFDLSASSSAATPINLSHHGYFCLDRSGDIRRHQLQIAAEHYLPVDAAQIPTGEIAAVAGTAQDFRMLRQIAPGGYDHNFCLSAQREAPRHVATLIGEQGLRMEVETSEPGLQVYDGRHFDGLAGLGGQTYNAYAGLALETQGWPDAVNQPAFPETILRPDQTYHTTTRYRFRE